MPLASIVPFVSPPTTLHVPPEVEGVIGSFAPTRTDVCCGVMLSGITEEVPPDEEDALPDDKLEPLILNAAAAHPVSKGTTTVVVIATSTKLPRRTEKNLAFGNMPEGTSYYFSIGMSDFRISGAHWNFAARIKKS